MTHGRLAHSTTTWQISHVPSKDATCAAACQVRAEVAVAVQYQARRCGSHCPAPPNPISRTSMTDEQRAVLKARNLQSCTTQQSFCSSEITLSTIRRLLNAKFGSDSITVERQPRLIKKVDTFGATLLALLMTPLHSETQQTAYLDGRFRICPLISQTKTMMAA